MFRGNRPVAAILPIATTITPPIPSRIAFDTGEVYGGSHGRGSSSVDPRPVRNCLQVSVIPVAGVLLDNFGR
jgi:hypothetical protein